MEKHLMMHRNIIPVHLKLLLQVVIEFSHVYIIYIIMYTSQASTAGV